jgi:hypothetical protein
MNDLVAGIWLAVLLIIYLLPAMLGHNKKPAAGIWILNITLGWTVLGWLGALIWAASAERKETPKLS